MKTLCSNKSSQQIERKGTRKLKALPLVGLPLPAAFHHCCQIIVQMLPLKLELQSPPHKELALTVSCTRASLKGEYGSSSIGLDLGRSRWLRIVFGQSIERVQLTAPFQDNNEPHNSVFTDWDQWKTEVKAEPSTATALFLQPLLKLVQSRSSNHHKEHSLDHGAQLDGHTRALEGEKKAGTITSFIKSKLSERHTFRANINKFRSKHHMQLTSIEKEHDQGSRAGTTLWRVQTLSQKEEIRKTSSTLERDKVSYHQHLMKESNTSTSISNEPEIKFPKRIRKIRQLGDNKVGKSLKDTHFPPDASDCFPSKESKPKFYQRINLSQEEMDLKRKKFDSQFIAKHSTLIPQGEVRVAPEKNESQVTEDIIRADSQTVGGLDDSLERGFRGESRQKEVEESGTLYESVYQ